MWLFCKHRQSFTVLFLKLQKGTSVSLRPNSLFFCQKYTSCPNSCQLLPLFQHTHLIPRNVVLVLITTASVCVNKPDYSCFNNIPSTWQFRAFFSVPMMPLQIHKTYCTSRCQSAFLLRIEHVSSRSYARPRVLCSVYKMFFIVLSSVNQIAYNIHVIWSSCHHVCIR